MRTPTRRGLAITIAAALARGNAEGPSGGSGDRGGGGGSVAVLHKDPIFLRRTITSNTGPEAGSRVCPSLQTS